MPDVDIQALVAELAALTGEAPRDVIVNALRMRLTLEQRREEVQRALQDLREQREEVG